LQRVAQVSVQCSSCLAALVLIFQHVVQLVTGHSRGST
jgi:hypothetical protein